MARPNDDPINFDYDSMEAALTNASDGNNLYTAIVNTPFEFCRVETVFLFLGIIVYLQVNEATGMIDRIALSNTELANNTTTVSMVPFNDIKIPLNHTENIISKAIQENKPQDTTDWKFLFEPALTAEQARINQASGGIAFSAVYPLIGTRTQSAMIFSYFQYLDNIGTEQHQFMQHYSSIVNHRLQTMQP